MSIENSPNPGVRTPNNREAVPSIVRMDFYSALQELSKGHRITRVEWANPKIFGHLKDGMVLIRKETGVDHVWSISDGDLEGLDWFIVEKGIEIK